MATLPVICMQSSALPVSEGKKCHQRSPPETSLCDNDNGDGINRQLRVRLLNLEVTPVTRISNSAVLEAIVTKKKNKIKIS